MQSTVGALALSRRRSCGPRKSRQLGLNGKGEKTQGREEIWRLMPWWKGDIIIAPTLPQTSCATGLKDYPTSPCLTLPFVLRVPAELAFSQILGYPKKLLSLPGPFCTPSFTPPAGPTPYNQVTSVILPENLSQVY